MIDTKIQEQHLSKPAYIYLRQSTMGQVHFNQESTQRQYALQDKAQQMGWPSTAIRVLDGDLGISGAHSCNREDFKILVADVSMGKVGAVFALEASRLSRSCTDWHRLLELCALTSTLIIDADGCYNPSDFNDQLLLGIKGTMSQAELHFIRARLQGGKINKAKRGELRSYLPVGFCYDEEGRTSMDADEQVRNSIQLLFKVFQETGSAYMVVRYFDKQNVRFPKRAHGGIWNGKIMWGTLSHPRVLGVLKNPSYAGTYVYGRYKSHKRLTNTGELQMTTTVLPQDQWSIIIKDHHESYITWEQYMANQEILKQNRTNVKGSLLPTAAREGVALLQGLLICGCCGRRTTVRYKGNGGIYPYYECNWKKREGLGQHICLTVRGDTIDQSISEKILKAIVPEQIEIAIKAFEELEQRSKALEKQWQMKIARADYEAQLAQKRYEEVDPSNRLVAGTLEKRWNEALIAFENTRSQYTEYQQKNVLRVTTQQKDKLLALATNLPDLWNASTTSAKDRKRIVRLLIKDVTIEKTSECKEIILHIRWQGGAVEDLKIPKPLNAPDKWRHPEELINKVRQYAVTMTDKQIVEELNRQGLKTNKGNIFTILSIKWIRYKHGINPPGHQKPGELLVKQVAKKFDVSHYIVRYWADTGIISARKIGKKLWLAIDNQKEEELKKLIATSTKIAIVRARSRNQIVGGAL